MDFSPWNVFRSYIVPNTFEKTKQKKTGWVEIVGRFETDLAIWN